MRAAVPCSKGYGGTSARRSSESAILQRQHNMTNGSHLYHIRPTIRTACARRPMRPLSLRRPLGIKHLIQHQGAACSLWSRPNPACGPRCTFGTAVYLLPKPPNAMPLVQGLKTVMTQLRPRQGKTTRLKKTIPFLRQFLPCTGLPRGVHRLFIVITLCSSKARVGLPSSSAMLV